MKLDLTREQRKKERKFEPKHKHWHIIIYK